MSPEISEKYKIFSNLVIAEISGKYKLISLLTLSCFKARALGEIIISKYLNDELWQIATTGELIVSTCSPGKLIFCICTYYLPTTISIFHFEKSSLYSYCVFILCGCVR